MEGIIIAILSSGALSAAVSGLINIWQKKQEKDSSLIISERQTYYRRIKGDCEKYIAAGEIPADKLEDLIEDHRIYHDVLYGNGFLDDLMAEVKTVKVIF